jgi:hypothetical protein
MPQILPGTRNRGNDPHGARRGRQAGTLGTPLDEQRRFSMTYPPTPGGWPDPAGGYGPAQGQPAYPDPAQAPPAYYDPASGQPTYIDPISGQPAAVSPTPYAAAQPGYPAYPAAPQPYGAPLQPAYPGYAGYGVPGIPTGPKTNGLAIASMVVSLSGAALLFCYGGGLVLGVVGAILGHVSRRQIATRGEGGGGMALAGIIVGWITLAIGLIVVAGIIWFAYFVVHNSPSYNYSTPDPFSS